MSTSTSPTPRVLILNGGSSSGKTTLAKQLQVVLPGEWLRLGVDTLVDACPPRLLTIGGIEFGAGGGVNVGPAFAEIELVWMAGLARMAELGAQILIEDNFVSGPASQARWRAALDGLSVGWVGVRCPAVEAGRREQARGDRVPGMAAIQATAVHRDIGYDIEVNTFDLPVADNAEVIRRRFFADDT